MTSNNSDKSVAIAIGSNQSEIDVEPQNGINKFRNVFRSINPFKRKNTLSRNAKSCNSYEATTNKEDYRIAISQDGKFAVTFDTANLRIKILKNTDHRPFKKKTTGTTTPNSNYQNESDEINETIAYFKITDDLDIDKIYDTAFKLPLHNGSQEISDDSLRINAVGKNGSGSNDIMVEKVENIENTPNKDDEYRWSFDISNVQCKNNGECFIFVAVSRVDVNKVMTGSNNEDDEYINGAMDENGYEKITSEWSPEEGVKIYAFNDEIKSGTKGTVVYCIRLREGNEKIPPKKGVITYYHFGNVSGICRFVEDDLDDDLDSVKKNVEQNEQSGQNGQNEQNEQNEQTYQNNQKNQRDQKNQKDQKKPRRFIVLNFYGIYNFECDDDFNFKFNEKFHYPNSIRRELDYWYTKKDCTDRLLSCLYDKYLLVKQYKNDVQSLEVYDLAEMKLQITAKCTEKDKRLRKHRNIFTISKLQLCFTQGNNSVKLYFLENGLEVASKSFDEIDEIYSLGFFDSDEKLLIIGKSKDISNDKNQLMLIIWDLYYTGKVEPIASDDFVMTKGAKDRLAITSGNILQIDDNGNVTSVVKKIENKSKRDAYLDIEWDENSGEISNDEVNKSHIIHLEKNLADENEPWVLDDYEREIYCLYHDDKEYLKLIVGRSTVQIWHRVQIQDDKEKINNGEPFLEYIWTNGIPVNQEREATKLRVEEFKYAKIQNNNQNNNQDSSTLNDRINDFYLKVCWYERITKVQKSEKDNKKKGAKKEEAVIKEENDEIESMWEMKEKRKTRMKRKEKVIRWQDINEKVSAVRHACRALHHLNRRTEFFKDNYDKMLKYEEIVKYIKYIVWKFIEHEPDQFILLDVRHNVMKNLILGDCDHLIKFILFGDKKDHKHIKDKYGDKIKELPEIRHIPRSISWPGKKYIKNKELDDLERSSLDDDDETRPENDMELAICYCKGRELKDTIIVAYLLEYYSGRAVGCAGWMDTVSKALPLLFKYNYDDYAKKLFHKECFADQDHFSAQDPFEIIPKKYLVRRNHNIKFRAFKPRDELQSDKFEWYDRIWFAISDLFCNCFKHTRKRPNNNNDLKFKHKMYKYIEDLDNDLGKSPLALRVVPLPGFTINSIPVSKPEYNLMKIFLNICWSLLIPRWYKVSRNDKNSLSPFSRVIQYENNDDIYDNPATEAVIDFRWRNARNYFFSLFIRFLIFASCFGLISWTYLVHNEISERFLIFLKIVIGIFYYLAFYLLAIEVIQLFHHGLRNYIDIFNILDVCSIVLPVTVTTLILNNFQFSNGFGSIESVDNSLMIAISFSIFILWIELISYFRLMSNMALYIYYVLIIFKAVFPFILFLVIVVVAFAHTMFILLRDPDYTILKNSTLSGVATDTLTNEIFNISLQVDFNATNSEDNPFSKFHTAIEASYFWLSGDWIQRGNFDFWAVEVFSLLASIFLVVILQNMMIAFMGGVYERAETKGRQTLLRYRANQIADYEALHHIHFRYKEPEPKYIYYIGQSKNFEEWYDARKGIQGAIYRGFEEKSTFTKRTFKKSDYDDVSIWKYEGIKVIDKQIQEAERAKKVFDAHIEELCEKLEDVQENREAKDQLRKKLAALKLPYH